MEKDPAAEPALPPPTRAHAPPPPEPTPAPAAPVLTTPPAPRGSRWGRLRGVGHCCTHCGYPQRSLCCFGCSYTTRAIFIGSGGVMAGLAYLLLLCGLLICSGSSVLGDDPYATTFLVLGIIYMPMGLTLIYSAQTMNTLVLVPWIILNFIFAFLETIGVILAPILASRRHTVCGKGRIAIAAFVLQVFIVGCRCYCIAVITQYRHKVLAAKALRQQRESNQPLVI